MKLSWTLNLAIFMVVAPTTWWLLDNYPPDELLDRSEPYTRISDESVILPTAPEECGLPSGTIPNEVKWDGCNRTSWKVIPHIKSCVASSSNPFVERTLTDADGKKISLPLEVSQFANKATNANSKMSRTFIQPRTAPGETKYEAKVCYECLLSSGRINPIDKIAPRCVTKGVITYMVNR